MSEAARGAGSHRDRDKVSDVMQFDDSMVPELSGIRVTSKVHRAVWRQRANHETMVCEVNCNAHDKPPR